MSKRNELKDRIYTCQCKCCRALVWLREDCGAELQVSPTRAGRLCELAVVAAAGRYGLPDYEVVAQRRAYAAHLDLVLSGPTSNADSPVHIAWAVTNSNQNSNARNRVNLGSAQATYTDGVYRLH